jgi:NADH dehydrogenase FAD-containing subunit
MRPSIMGELTFHASYQTAQVASQQGKYIGKKLTKLAQQRKTLTKNDLFDDDDSTYYKPFEYRHLGSLAYIGNAVCTLSFAG